jgi:DNA-binding LacI/PurR family transcriptional regulator
MRQKRPTFQELAKLANVSQATVSRIAAGRPNVDSTIRERVQQTARNLGLDLDRRRDDSSRTLAFVLGNRDVLHSFHARVLAGAESYAAAHDWEMFHLTLRYQPGTPTRELRLPQILQRRSHVRGLILAGVNSMNLLHALQQRHIPFSVLGNNLLGDDLPDFCDLVYSDDVRGGFDVTTHLIGLGHRHIWFIGDTRMPWFTRCGTGYQQAMAQAGLEPHVCEFHSDGRELGYLGAKSLLSPRVPASAIFAGSDQVAAGVYAALREARVAVPDDISVVGFSDSEAAILLPALTSVREFPEELGRQLAAFALSRIRDPAQPARQLTIPTQLVVRESTHAAAPSFV